jgi:hypothetical protein
VQGPFDEFFQYPLTVAGFKSGLGMVQQSQRYQAALTTHSSSRWRHREFVGPAGMRQNDFGSSAEQNMEVKGATFLYTLATLMITFAGFSALLLAVRPAAGARLSLLDRYLAKTVMSYIFVLTAGALLPSLFALYDVQETWVWRGSVVIFALPMLSLQVTYPRRRRRVVGDGPPPAIFAVFVVLGSATTLAMLCYVLEGLPNSAAAYITALTIDFFTVIFGFLVALDVIMQQPMEAAVRPAPLGEASVGCDTH